MPVPIKPARLHDAQLEGVCGLIDMSAGPDPPLLVVLPTRLTTRLFPAFEKTNFLGGLFCCCFVVFLRLCRAPGGHGTSCRDAASCGDRPASVVCPSFVLFLDEEFVKL